MERAAQHEEKKEKENGAVGDVKSTYLICTPSKSLDQIQKEIDEGKSEDEIIKDLKFDVEVIDGNSR